MLDSRPISKDRQRNRRLGHIRVLMSRADVAPVIGLAEIEGKQTHRILEEQWYR